MNIRIRIALTLFAVAGSIAIALCAAAWGQTLEAELAVGRSFFFVVSALSLALALSIFTAPDQDDPRRNKLEALAMVACGYIGGLTLVIGAIYGPAVFAWAGCALVVVGAFVIQAPRIGTGSGWSLMRFSK